MLATGCQRYGPPLCTKINTVYNVIKKKSQYNNAFHSN
jgi:hypothetical protein